MLQKRQENKDERKKIQYPAQDRAPSYEQCASMMQEAQNNIGRMVELPFGRGPATFSLTVQSDGKIGPHWMLYRFEEGRSSLEWDYRSTDANMIHNTICAQFTDADLNPDVAKLQVANAPEITFSKGPDGEARPTSRAAVAETTDKPVMEGDLQKLQLPNLLQSVAMGKMSGRLEIKASNDLANLHFFEGTLIHCVTSAGEGDAAVLELMGLSGGNYRFFQEALPEKQSVRRRLDALLVEGAALVDQAKYLDQLGLTQESYLHRIHASITESAFEQTAGKGRPDMNFQKMLYQAIDGHTQLVELLRQYPLPKRDWVPVIYNLIQTQLIGFKNEAPVLPRAPVEEREIQPTDIDWSVVRGAEKSLIRTDSGLFSYPAFLGFLERELHRFEVFRHPFSIIVLEFKLRKDKGYEPLPVRGLLEAVKRVEKLKRKTDLVAHYETFSLGILLAETNAASARTFIRPLAGSLSEPSLLEGVDSAEILISVGMGSIPDDCMTIEHLLTVSRPR